MAPAEQLAASQAAPPVILLHPDEHLPAKAPAKGHKLVLLLVSTGLVLMLSGGGAAAYYSLRPSAAPAVHVTPSPTPKPTPSPSPTDSPTPSASPSPSITLEASPSPSPSPAAAPVEVTAPSTAPTAAHPQIVTVKSPSGLWLRSTASSANKSNIIGWLPNGAQVSVDSIGDFWWHGTYSGKTGYFAVSYTK